MIDNQIFSQDEQVIYYIVLCSLVLLLFVFAGILFFYFSNKKILIRKLEAKQQELDYQKKLLKTTLMVQEERERISSDLHDDIGSTLSTIRLQFGFLIKEIKNPDQIRRLEDMRESVQHISDSLKELIWSLNLRNDTLDNFIVYTKKFLYNYLDISRIQGEFLSSMILEDIILKSPVRRNLFLVIKEILHNAVKHSNAKNLTLDLTYTDSDISISILDDGDGLPSEMVYGNGIINIKKRMKSINGEVFFVSSEEGLRIDLQIPRQ